MRCRVITPWLHVRRTRELLQNTELRCHPVNYDFWSGMGPEHSCFAFCFVLFLRFNTQSGWRLTEVESEESQNEILQTLQRAA